MVNSTLTSGLQQPLMAMEMLLYSSMSQPVLTSKSSGALNVAKIAALGIVEPSDLDNVAESAFKQKSTKEIVVIRSMGISKRWIQSFSIHR